MPKRRIEITRAAAIKKLKGRNQYSCRFRVPIAPGSIETYWSPWFKFSARTTYEKESEVMRIRTEYEDEINGKTCFDDSLFGEFAEKWHNNRKDSGALNELSWIREGDYIKQIQESSLANIRIGDIIPTDIEVCIAELRRDPSFTESKVDKLYSKVKQILGYAAKHRIIPFNPCDLIEYKSKAKTKERECLPDEALKVLYEELSKPPRLGAVVCVRIVTECGFRRGEALGLMKHNLNFIYNEIDLDHQLNAKSKIVDPKYDSKRSVPMSTGLRAYLIEWLQYIADTFFDGSINSIPDDFPICCNTQGRFYLPSNFDRWRRDFFVSLGLARYEVVKERRADGTTRKHKVNYEGFDLHCLRHSALTNILANGADLRSTMDIAGHTKITTTQSYLHAKKDKKQQAMTDYSDFLSNL